MGASADNGCGAASGSAGALVGAGRSALGSDSGRPVESAAGSPAGLGFCAASGLALGFGCADASASPSAALLGPALDPALKPVLGAALGAVEAAPGWLGWAGISCVAGAAVGAGADLGLGATVAFLAVAVTSGPLGSAFSAESATLGSVGFGAGDRSLAVFVGALAPAARVVAEVAAGLLAGSSARGVSALSVVSPVWRVFGSAVAGVLGLAEALVFLLEFGFFAIATHLRDLGSLEG